MQIVDKKDFANQSKKKNKDGRYQIRSVAPIEAVKAQKATFPQTWIRLCNLGGQHNRVEREVEIRKAQVNHRKCSSSESGWNWEQKK